MLLEAVAVLFIKFYLGYIGIIYQEKGEIENALGYLKEAENNVWNLKKE